MSGIVPSEGGSLEVHHPRFGRCFKLREGEGVGAVS